MRAAVVRRYGPPEAARVTDVDHPGRPGSDEVVVRVEATTVNSGDARIRGANFPPGFGVLARLGFGIRGPRRSILGNTFAGEVGAVGDGVVPLEPGDRVCGMTGIHMGAHAEYLKIKAKKVVRIPDAVSYDDAAGVLFGGTTALFFLRDKASISTGSTVLVNGASGAVGSASVQLAKHFGAAVTGVASGKNAEVVTSLGADRTIDHTAVDVAAIEDRFDVVIDTVGNLSMAEGRRLLTDGGVLLLVVGGLAENLRARGNVRTGMAAERTTDFTRLLEMVERGELRVLIDDVLTLDQIVEAHRRVDSGRKVGSLIVRP